MADNFTNLEPQTNREWMQLIVRKIDDLAESQQEDREDFMSMFDKWNTWKECHDKELAANLGTLTKHNEKIDQLEKKVTAWSLTNTLAAIGAFITAIFMKGS